MTKNELRDTLPFPLNYKLGLGEELSMDDMTYLAQSGYGWLAVVYHELYLSTQPITPHKDVMTLAEFQEIIDYI